MRPAGHSTATDVPVLQFLLQVREAQDHLLATCLLEVDHRLKVRAEPRQFADDAAAKMRVPDPLALDETRRVLRIGVIDDDAGAIVIIEARRALAVAERADAVAGIATTIAAL